MHATHAHQTNRFFTILGIIVAVICIMAVLLLSVFSARRSTESRSQASNTQGVSLSVQAKTEADLQRFEVSLDGMNPEDHELRSFRATIRLDATTSAVLGTTTIRGRDRTEDLPASPMQLSENNRKDERRVCLDAIENANGELKWASPCRGDQGAQACSGEKIPLTAEEKVRYDAWVALKKPKSSRCVSVPVVGSPVQRIASARPLATLTTASSSPSPATPSTTEEETIRRFVKEGVTIESTPNGLILKEPTVRREADSLIVTLEGSKPVLPKASLSGRLQLSTIILPRPSAKTWYTATLIDTSVRGVSTLAPGVEIELLTPSKE